MLQRACRSGVMESVSLSNCELVPVLRRNAGSRCWIGIEQVGHSLTLLQIPPACVSCAQNIAGVLTHNIRSRQ